MQVETATVGHSQHWGFMDRGIQPLLRDKRIAGTAVTLAIPGQDSTLLHHTLGLLRPGDILVVDRLGDDKHACWGGGVTVAAKAAGALGGIVDGPCTDLTEIEDSDFPDVVPGHVADHHPALQSRRNAEPAGVLRQCRGEARRRHHRRRVRRAGAPAG